MLGRNQLSLSLGKSVCSYFVVLLNKGLGARVVKRVIDVVPAHFLSCTDVLRPALSSEHSFIVVLFSTVEAVGMNSAQIEQEKIELLLRSQLLTGFQKFIDRVELLLWVKHLGDELLAQREILFKAIVRKRRCDADRLA